MSIASEITRLQGVKSDILTAIGNKGVTVPADAMLDDCPTLIGQIETGGGGDVLLGIMNKTITSVDIPNGVTSIANAFFSSCNELETVTFPTSITTLGTDCFNSCRSLVEVCLFENVTSIGIRCFAYCSSLEKVVIMATNPPSLGANVFASTPIASGTGKIYVPNGYGNTYKSASGWSAFANQIYELDSNGNIPT